jgi:hypothetical protein
MGKSTKKFMNDSIASCFTEILLMHGPRPACWYHINYIEFSERNLSQYLGLSKDEYHAALETMNLVKWAKKGTEQTLWHRNDEWKELLGRYMIEMSNLTTQAVKEVSTSVKKLHWIRLGMVGKEIYQPKTQPETVKLQLFERLERKHLEEGDISLASKLSFLVRGELELQKSGEELDALERQKQLENEDGEDSQTTIGRRNQRSEEVQNDEGSSGTTGAVIENEPSIELDPLTYPTLLKAGITVNATTLNSLLREIILVSKKMPDAYVLQHETYNGAKRKIVVVPQVSTEKSFNNHGKKLLKDVQKHLVSDAFCKSREKNEHDATIETIRAEEEKRMVKNIIKHYCVSESDIFVEVAQEQGLDFKKKVMSPEYAAAMLSEAGIGPTKSRVLNRYITAFLGKRLMPAEAKIYRSESSIDDLPPVVRTKQLEDKTKVRFFVKPLDKVVSLGIEKKLKHMKEEEIKRSCKLDISWSADHGGGFFRAVAKVALRFPGDKKTLSFKHRIGQMQCKKDTYDVISKTMGPDLNAGLCSMLEADRKTSKSAHVCKQQDNKYILVTGTNTIPPNCEVVKTIGPEDISIAVTGDLAFYALMLGKPGMDSKWCFLCDCAASAWACMDQVKGIMWSNELMNEKRTAIAANPKMKQSEKKGIKFIPILDVDPSLFIPPPLHIKLGLVNRAFIKTDTGKSYMSWSQARMENIPIAERIATNLFINADAELTDRKEDKTLWDLRHKQDLDDAKERLSELTSQLRQRNIPNDEKTRLLTDKAVTNEEIAGLNASFKRIVDDLKKARSSRKTLKAAYESEKKKRTYHSKLIHNKKEEAMREIGVDRGAAHGGDLQGRGCTNLLQKADQFFEKCLAIDLEAFDADNNSVLASRDEIVIVNQRFKELAILLERLMYFLMLDHDEVDAYEGEKTLHEDIDTHIEVLVWQWNHLRLSMAAAKFHLVKDHGVDSFIRWHAIGPRNEEFVEADHVKGNSEVSVYAALNRNPQRREDAISKNAVRTSNPAVQAIIKEISPEKQRKRKRLTEDDRGRVIGRRLEVFNTIRFRKSVVMAAADNSTNAQIPNYWSLATDKV